MASRKLLNINKILELISFNYFIILTIYLFEPLDNYKFKEQLYNEPCVMWTPMRSSLVSV